MVKWRGRVGGKEIRRDRREGESENQGGSFKQVKILSIIGHYLKWTT